MVWDADGRVRLDREATAEAWDAFHKKTVAHYGFDEAQKQHAQRLLDAYLGQADEILVDEKEEIGTYFKGLERRARNQSDRVRQEVASLKGQAEKIEADLKKDRGPWLGRLDKLWSGLERDLNAIATPEQHGRGAVQLDRPKRSRFDADTMDKYIPWMHIGIGVCLVIGFFTRTAAWAAAAFLLSVVATQPPWVSGTAPVYYQTVELLAVVVVATAGAGRYMGFDSLLRTLRMRCCPPKTGTET
jgi:uncharacterized membrane protein YphA (DoxX/SURF4 family)